MHSLALFIEKLEFNFGPYDPKGNTKVSLHKLEMKENHQINCYIVDFTKYTSHLDWNEPPLCNNFYQGLPLQLCTELL
jgi:hypothetical protein